MFQLFFPGHMFSEDCQVQGQVVVLYLLCNILGRGGWYLMYDLKADRVVCFPAPPTLLWDSENSRVGFEARVGFWSALLWLSRRSLPFALKSRGMTGSWQSAMLTEGVRVSIRGQVVTQGNQSLGLTVRSIYRTWPPSPVETSMTKTLLSWPNVISHVRRFALPGWSK